MIGPDMNKRIIVLKESENVAVIDIVTGETCAELKEVPRTESALLVNGRLISFNGHEL